MIDFSLPYSKPDFNSFLEGFLPEDYLREEEEIDIPFQSKYFEKATYLGESANLNLSVYEVYHNSEHDARVGLTREMFRLMAHFGKRRSLVVLVPKNGNTYRFSLVTIDLKLNENENITREYSNPKRYSFILGENAKAHTPQRFLIAQGRVTDFDDLLKRFSVEVVNKEFYKQIAVMFSRLVGGKRKLGSRTKQYDHDLELPSTPYDRHEQKYKEFAVRLIGRTVFCWFLKKKKSANDIPLIPEDVLSTQAISQNPNYYHSRVEPLFFNVLNTSVNDREKAYKEKPYDIIPFLNGGLFEPQPDDFYAQNRPNYALKIPDEWWKDFIEILETYNFTIDENTSIDIDLSVDPEMLGRIFENLLAEINPETGETARKSTGSYYTPRPIVEYMVDESLKQYLVTKTGIEEENLEILLDYSREESGLQPNEEQKVIEALNTIKVLDPACGSGAFPMGILQKMLLILQKVDHEAQNSIEQILSEIKDPVSRKIIEQKLKDAKVYEDEDLDDYFRKLNIIRRSIYGVDIQPVAVDIAKLRFFLSIIVDEVIQDELPNRGIEPLPNLEFKFVCANTLIPLPPNRELFENADFIEKLEELREQYFISFGEEKEKIKKEFRSVQAQMFNTSIDLLNREPGTHNDRPQTQTQMLATWNPFRNETTKWFDPKWMFGETDKMDIVIGNPPYGAKITNSEMNSIIPRIKNTSNKNSAALFIDVSKNYLIHKNGVLSYIVPKSLIYSEKWQSLFYSLLNKTSSIVDVEKGFDDVLLEQVVFVFNNSASFKNYKSFKYYNPNIYFRAQINSSIPKLFEAWLVDVTEESLKVGLKLNQHTKLKEYSSSKRGKGLQKYLTPKGDYEVVGGKEITREGIRGIKGYLSKKIANNFDLNYYQQPKIVCQDIVAHIQNPYPYIKITSYVDSNGSILSVDTVQNIIILNNDFSLEALNLLLNSKLINWYAYKFIYCSAIRTMHFDKYYQGKIPVHKTVLDNDNWIREFWNNADLKYGDCVDLMVYKLYDLTWDEALIVDPELPGIISREDYEKAGMEELAEWENV